MKKGQGLINEWVESFIIDRRIQNVSPGTVGFYRDKLGKFAKWSQEQGVSQVADLTPHHLRLFLIYLEQVGHNAGGRHCFFRALRTFLIFYEEEAEPEGWKNPIRRIKAPRLPQKPLKPVSLPDVGRLIGTCSRSDFYGLRDRAILLLLLDTGVRANELVGMDLEDLDLIKRSIQVWGKGRKVREVLFGRKTKRELKSWLRKRRAKSKALFTKTDGSRIRYTTLRTMLNRRSKRVGITGVCLHDFRRAFCLNQLQAGTPETTIARLMGHANTQLIAVYARQTTRNLQEVFHSIGDCEL